MSRAYSKWTKEEIQIIRENYQILQSKDIIKLMPNHTLASLKRMICKLKLTKPQFKKHNLSILLEETPISLYWLGFLCADGNIEEGRKISITIQSLDKQHLQRYLDYVGSSNIPHLVKGSNCLRIALTDIKTVTELIKRFKLSSNKTHNPINLSYFKNKSPELFLSFICGFIDGDGSIRKIGKNSYTISIVGYKTWLNNFQVFFKFLHKYFNSSITSRIPYKDKKNTTLPQDLTKTKKEFELAQFRIHKKDIIIPFKEKIVSLNLPFLARKWDKIN